VEHADEVEWFTKIMKRVEESYVDGKPPHLAKPDESIFQVITYDKFREMEGDEMQAIWKKKQMVITGLEKPSYGFDREGMMTLTYPSRIFTIQGMSTHDLPRLTLIHVIG
jgi:hypothetical protein